MDGYEKLNIECENNIKFFTRHLENLRKYISMQEEARILLDEISPQTDLDFKEMEHFNNYNGYVTIAILELSVNLKNLIVAKTDFEKIFFIKNSFLIIHETINKLSPSKGKSFVQLTIEKKYPTLEVNFHDLLNDIKIYKETVNYKKIEDTRHFTAGHIEKSLKKYYDTIINLDGEEAGNYIIHFLKILDKTSIFTKDYAVLSNNIIQEKSRNLNTELDNIFKKLEELIVE